MTPTFMPVGNGNGYGAGIGSVRTSDKIRRD